MVHTGFRREFGLMPSLVRAVTDGDRQRVAIVADHIDLLGIALHEHHHGEDQALWPLLLERCPTDLAPVVHGMQEDHDRIAGLISELAHAVTAWRANADPNDRAAAAGILDQLLPVLREHLGTEVRLVMPLVEQYISAAEWNTMSAVHSNNRTPDQIALTFGMVMYEGEPAAIQDHLKDLPPATRPVFEKAARTAYAAYAKILYGTSTPPRIGIDI
ncbi:hemerythrin domain-containing protein [Actinospica robiniae]|uniref:hemerythrin domain-containing protein n=1 Tax=Actinospica robiniae TaxID=304901 RepID=UPI00146F9D8C|nr:hemerythrin domain-containing protein [Actinospica robiniae]